LSVAAKSAAVAGKARNGPGGLIVTDRNRIGRAAQGTFAVRLRENDVYTDGRPKPASAWKKKKIITPSGRVEYRNIRPGFAEVLDAITTRQVNGAIFESIDRALRTSRDCDDLLDACEFTSANVRSLDDTLTITNGGTERERDNARSYALGAARSSADTSRRVANARERLNGKSYQGGPRPYGYVRAQNTEKYQRTLIIVPDEKDVLLEMADDILNKDLSLRAVARDLRERGILTAKGRTNWMSRNVKEVLTKPAIAGLATHKGTLTPAPWEAILERDVWERLKARLEDPSRRTSDRSNEPRHIVSGIALCGKCQDGTTVRATGPRDKTFYTCRKVYHLKRYTDDVDAWVERNITAYISENGMDILRPEPKPDVDTDGLRDEAKESRKRQKTQIDLHREGLIDDNELKRTLRAFKERLATIDAQLAHSDEPDPIPEFRHHGPVRQIWKDLSLARKRVIIQLLTDITMLPTSRRGRAGFDPDSVRITVKETGDVLDVRTRS
jgi:hypothetical protein